MSPERIEKNKDIFPGPPRSTKALACAHHRAQGIMFGKASSMFGAAKQGMGMGEAGRRRWRSWRR